MYMYMYMAEISYTSWDLAQDPIITGFGKAVARKRSGPGHGRPTFLLLRPHLLQR